MASLRLGIAASLKEASGPTACGRQDEARPTASPATQQKRRRKAAHAAKPAQETKRGRLRDREKPKRVSPCERDSNLSVTVGEHVDALWPADGEYYPAGIRAVNADGTISLAYDDGDTRSDARTHELRHKRPPTGAHPDTVSTEAHCASVTCSETSAVPAVSSSIEAMMTSTAPTRHIDASDIDVAIGQTATASAPSTARSLSYDSVAPNPIGVPPPTPQLVYEKDKKKEASATWAELAESVQKSPGRFDAAARRLQALLLPPAAKTNTDFPRGAPARSAVPHDTAKFPGPFYTTSPDMKDTKIADKVEELLEATYEEAKKFHTKTLGKNGVTTDDCVRIVKRLLMRGRRFADIKYMCDEKRFPVRVLILADVVRARMHYNWTTTRCRLEYIQPEAHASPDDIVMRGDKGLQFIVLRSLDGRRPFAAPCADLARSLEDIARHDPGALEFGVKIGTHDRPIVYQAAWKAGEVPNIFLKGITTSVGGRPRPQLQERVRHHLTEIYLIARRYLYQQLLPHETAARAFDMRPWLGDRDEATPRIPLLGAVWGLFPAAAAHQDNDVAPGLLAMCDCNAPPAEGEDPDQTPPTGPQRALGKAPLSAERFRSRIPKAPVHAV